MINEIETILCKLRNWPYRMADPDFITAINIYIYIYIYVCIFIYFLKIS